MNISGTHHKSKNCDPKLVVNALKRSYFQKQKQFFPENLTMNGINTNVKKIIKSNGGWSDPRDHKLCKSFQNFKLENVNKSASI